MTPIAADEERLKKRRKAAGAEAWSVSFVLLGWDEKFMTRMTSRVQVRLMDGIVITVRTFSFKTMIKKLNHVGSPTRCSYHSLTHLINLSYSDDVQIRIAIYLM